MKGRVILFLFLLATSCGSSSDVTGELVLNDGAESVEGLTVTAKLTGSSEKDNITAYILSESSDVPTTDSTLWISVDPANPVTVESSFNLSPAVGNHLIYAWLKDAQGNISDEITASITVQSPPGGITGAITINSGATYSNAREASLVLSGLSEGSITGYLVSEDKNAPGVGDNSWAKASYSPSPSPSPVKGEGIKKNPSESPPPLWGRIKGEGEKGDGEPSRTIQVQNSSTKDLTPSTSGFSKTVSYTLSATDGLKTVYLHLKDSDGRRSSSSSTITLDTTAPSGTLLIDGGNKLTLESDADVSESVTATDNSGIIAYLFSTEATPPSVSSSSWVAVTSATSLTQSQNTTLSSPMRGKKTLYVHLKDKANNIQTLSDEIEVLRIFSTSFSGTLGQYSSIALDSSNLPYFSYYEAGSAQNLAYSDFNGSTFGFARLDSTGDVGAGTSMAIDSNGKFHIAYRDTTNGTLKYATNKSGSLVTETVKVGGIDEAGGVSPSIAVDGNGTVHISHQASNKVRYVTGTAGSWNSQVVLDDSAFADPTVLTIDGSGKLHVVGRAIGGMYYGSNTSGSWVEERIVSGTVGGGGIVVTNSNNIFVCFAKGFALNVAQKQNSDWTLTEVDPASTGGDSITVDSKGSLHTCYYDSTNKDLKYATNLTGSWSTMTLDSGGDVGDYCGIAVDGNNRLHISYYDSTNGDLKYATTSD